MKRYTYVATLFVILVFSAAWFSGCEKITDMGLTDSMVKPPDVETMSTIKVGVIRPPPLLQFW